MIEKKIHYIWLSNNEPDNLAKKCLASWKRVLPDFEIKKWSLSDFDLSSMPAFVHEAMEMKKWALAADYLRLYILYNEGGIYLDSDIYILRRLDCLLDNRAFSFIECHKGAEQAAKKFTDTEGFVLTEDYIPGFCIQAAAIGSETGNPFIKAAMSYYETHHFTGIGSGKDTGMIAPDIYAKTARDFGFRYRDIKQDLNSITLYPSNLLGGAPDEFQKTNFAVHLCAGSWRDASAFRKVFGKLRRKATVRILELYGRKLQGRETKHF